MAQNSAPLTQSVFNKSATGGGSSGIEVSTKLRGESNDLNAALVMVVAVAALA